MNVPLKLHVCNSFAAFCLDFGDLLVITFAAFCLDFGDLLVIAFAAFCLDFGNVLEAVVSPCRAMVVWCFVPLDFRVHAFRVSAGGGCKRAGEG